MGFDKWWAEWKDAFHTKELLARQAWENGRKEEKERLALDTDLSDTHRAIHRVVRALNDGECPRCHRLDPNLIGYKFEFVGVGEPVYWGCGLCGFRVTFEEAQEAMKLFAPKMEAALALFEKWRTTLPRGGTTAADPNVDGDAR